MRQKGYRDILPAVSFPRRLFPRRKAGWFRDFRSECDVRPICEGECSLLKSRNTGGGGRSLTVNRQLRTDNYFPRSDT